jgi:RNA polymerase sigma-70 factor (ECF subfamily)
VPDAFPARCAIGLAGGDGRDVTTADDRFRPGLGATERPPRGAEDERALVAACLSGESGAFDAIVERHRSDVYRLCYRFTGNHEDATDLAQEVFLRAYRALGRFKGQSALGTWLYRIAVNACLNRVTARQPVIEALDGGRAIASSEPDQASRLLERERARRVREAITRLPPKQRATLVLRVYHEMSHREIARVVGGSVGGVKANLFHALRNLKRMLSGESL